MILIFANSIFDCILWIIGGVKEFTLSRYALIKSCIHQKKNLNILATSPRLLYFIREKRFYSSPKFFIITYTA